jgi:hypothetical protein
VVSPSPLESEKAVNVNGALLHGSTAITVCVHGTLRHFPAKRKAKVTRFLGFRYLFETCRPIAFARQNGIEKLLSAQACDLAQYMTELKIHFAERLGAVSVGGTCWHRMELC